MTLQVIPNNYQKKDNQMTTIAIAPTTKAEVRAGGSLSFSCDVSLSEAEQIIISVEEAEYDWATQTSTKTGVIKKYRLETISYRSGYSTDNEAVAISNVEVRGFKKDGGLRYRTEHLYRVTNDITEQIPDSYHDYARKEFAKSMVELQDRLTQMTNNGVNTNGK